MKFKFVVFALMALLSSCVTSQYTVQVPSTVDMPKRAIFLSQSGTQSALYQTVIDLENNEMVILEYHANRLSMVYRTGVTLNPDDYQSHKVVGTDAPLKEEGRLNENRNHDGTPDHDGNPTNKI
ncbi:MAG: hypothetical protein ACEPOZ_04195 [Marinifilaceae bacterium]